MKIKRLTQMNANKNKNREWTQ